METVRQLLTTCAVRCQFFLKSNNSKTPHVHETKSSILKEFLNFNKWFKMILKTLTSSDFSEMKLKHLFKFFMFVMGEWLDERDSLLIELPE